MHRIQFSFPDLSKAVLGLVLFLLAALKGVGAQQSFALGATVADLPPANKVAAGQTVTEDWNSLALADSTLHAIPPLLGEKDTNATFTRELLQVQWRPDDPIYLYVILPKGVPHPPAILYLYSYPSDIDRFRDDEFCSFLTKGGFAAVGFVSALTGHRYHDRPMREWFISELPESLAASTRDVQMILNYLATRGDIDMDHIGMFGDGSGATIAVLAATVDPRIKALDLLDPWGDWPAWLAKSPLIPSDERPSYLKPDFLQRLRPLDPMRRLSQLSSSRVRLQEAEYEKTTPKVAKSHLETAARSTVQLVRYKNSKAIADAAHGDRFFDWIKDQVKSDHTNPMASSIPVAVLPRP